MATAEQILIGLEGATLLALIVYVIQTGRIASGTKEANQVSREMIDEMREARKQESQPYVVVYFDLQYGQPTIEIVVENVGQLPAHDVDISFDPELKTGDERNPVTSVFEDGIKTIPPGQEIRAFFDVSHRYFDEELGLPRRYTARVSYAGGIDDARRTEEQTLDLAPYENLVYQREKGVHDLVETVDKIEKHQKEIPKEIEKLRERVSDGIWLQGTGPRSR